MSFTAVAAASPVATVVQVDEPPPLFYLSMSSLGIPIIRLSPSATMDSREPLRTTIAVSVITNPKTSFPLCSSSINRSSSIFSRNPKTSWEHLSSFESSLKISPISYILHNYASSRNQTVNRVSIPMPKFNMIPAKPIEGQKTGTSGLLKKALLSSLQHEDYKMNPCN
ncbi:hypothetical protein L1987_57668 [Smallanthus sonchifolius]|uniref:Uncharacterized protein n=1 Tax=Smallanthus sonchifolius TaxID=185202 RepID=A0ACB9DD89_9ASTR|nr:hypothetical protein L1987_57668 [Smallanthus sonchifolius]